MTVPRIPPALIIGLGLVATLAACTETSVPPTFGAADARRQMTNMVSLTTEAAGGDWSALSNGPASSECTTPDGSPGVTFSWAQERTGTDDPEALVRTVAAAWKQRDYDVTFQRDKIDDGRPLWSAVTFGHTVESISVNASARRVSIEVQSNCGAGDIADSE